MNIMTRAFSPGSLLAVLVLLTEPQSPPPAAVTSSSRVPLVKGLTIVTALFNEELGDRESVKSIVSSKEDAVQIAFHSQRDSGDLQILRTVGRADLRSAQHYRAAFSTEDGEVYPGTTALGVSAVVLGELKGNREVRFAIHVTIDGDAETLKGTIKGTGAGRFPVLLNDERAELPAVRATGSLGNRNAEFVFLDDPENPLTLRFRIGDEKLEVVRISYPMETSRIERALAASRRLAVYGIQFEFGSDRIRPVSEAVLREIADVLKKHRAWKVSIEGHTDSIGSDADNQQLSERRAAAVKNALVHQYGIGAGVLTTAGFGESRPTDTNETLQGRARNRRVELVLQ